MVPTVLCRPYGIFWESPRDRVEAQVSRNGPVGADPGAVDRPSVWMLAEGGCLVRWGWGVVVGLARGLSTV